MTDLSASRMGPSCMASPGTTSGSEAPGASDRLERPACLRSPAGDRATGYLPSGLRPSAFAREATIAEQILLFGEGRCEGVIVSAPENDSELRREGDLAAKIEAELAQAEASDRDMRDEPPVQLRFLDGPVDQLGLARALCRSFPQLTEFGRLGAWWPLTIEPALVVSPGPIVCRIILLESLEQDGLWARIGQEYGALCFRRRAMAHVGLSVTAVLGLVVFGPSAAELPNGGGVTAKCMSFAKPALSASGFDGGGSFPPDELLDGGSVTAERVGFAKASVGFAKGPTPSDLDLDGGGPSLYGNACSSLFMMRQTLAELLEFVTSLPGAYFFLAPMHPFGDGDGLETVTSP